MSTALATPDELDATLESLRSRVTLLNHVRTLHATRRRLLEQVADIEREIESSAEAVRLARAEIAGFRE